MRPWNSSAILTSTRSTIGSRLPLSAAAIAWSPGSAPGVAWNTALESGLATSTILSLCFHSPIMNGPVPTG
jgi:hypothetical protein